MGVADLLLAVLGPAVRGDVLHRPRPVERDHGGQLTDGVRSELLDVAAHAGRFELEDAERLAAREHRERRLVVVRDLLQDDLLAARLADQVDGAAQDG